VKQDNKQSIRFQQAFVKMMMRLSVFGATQMAQRKRHNGENNRLGLGLL